MLQVLFLSLQFIASLSATCDECWDEYSTCEWNAQSAAYDECAKVWEEGSQYPAFVKECIEQQASHQVQCYEEAGCFEAGNQDCWWKLWEFGCSPYQCESYTICTQEFINEQGCGQQLDTCSETCQHPEWEYVYEEIPECIRNHCGEIIQQCATSDACVEGIEGIANSCYNGQADPAECMDAAFIQDAEDTPSALNLCGGDETCATDLQQIGECIINSQCSEEENQEKFKKVARAIRFKKLQKAKVSRELARRRRVERRRPASTVAVRQSRPRRKVQSRRGREARRVRPRVERRRRRRRERRKLQSSGGCCDCTSSKDSPFCNTECNEAICPLDSYCCNNQWDWICADAAANVCNGEEAYGYTSSYTPYDSYTPYGSYTPFDYGSDNSGSCCDCQSSKGSPYCNKECDSELCPLDPYCCNNSWDWICANSATDVCYEQEQGGYGGYSSYDSYTYYPTPAPSNYDSSYDYSSYDPYSYSNYDYSPYDSYSGYDYSPYDYNSNYYDSYNYPSYDYSGYDSGYDNYYYPSYDYSGYDSYGSDYGYNYYDYSNYDYSGYDSCGPDSCGSGYDEPEEWEYDEEEIPTCIKQACGTQLAQCASSESCIEGIEGIANTCYNNNESPVECMNTLITESQGNGALELCNGNEQCSTDLQALGECVIQSANYGMCENEPVKKKKELLKGLVKGLKRIKKQRVERLKRRNKQKLGQHKGRENPRFRPRPRLVRRERVSKEERLRRDRARKASLAKRGRLNRRHRERARPRGVVREQRLRNKMQARPRPRPRRARQQRASRLASHIRARQGRRRRARPAPRRKERRKLQSSSGCCECTDAKGSPFCNSQCDGEICPLDSYCCNNSWDWICANAASNVCDGQDAYNYGPYSWDEPSYTPNEYGSENGGSCCDCQSSKGEAYCNSECDKEICPLDPYCCNNQWDWICADAASNVCNGQEAYGYNSYDSYYYPSYDYNSYDYYSSYDDFSYDPYSYSSYDYSSYDNYYSPSYDYSGYDSYNYPSYDYSSYDSYGYPSYDYSAYDSYNYPSYDYNSYDYSGYDSYNYPSYDYYDSYDSYDYPSYYDYSSDYYGYDSYNTNTYSSCGQIPDIPECIAANCCSDLSQCSSDSQCVSAVEGIAAECDHEDESAIAQCVEDVFINDVEQTKVYELCGGDQLCVESFTSLGQCAFYNCFSSSAQYLVKSLKTSLEFLRTTRANKLKKFNKVKSVKQQRATAQLKARRQFRKNKELKRVQQQQFNQQRRKYVNKRREFDARMKAKRAKKVKA